MSTFRARLVDACIVFTITVALLACVEAAARLATHAIDFFRNPPEGPAEYRLEREFYWAKQHEADSVGESSGYRTYVEFRENPHRSVTLNIDAEGRRLVPGNCESGSPFTIMAFGGSTMFGAGVPDQFTIPALMAAHFKRAGRCVKVVNYGAGWWQSTQSLIQLIEVLKGGDRPNAVVFYDGINEINAPALGGKAGGIDPSAESALRQALEPEEINVLRQLARSSSAVGMLRRVLAPEPGKSIDNDYAIPEGQRQAVAFAVAEKYAGNVRVVGALAREFGFDAYFFLQPCLVIAQRPYSKREEYLLRNRAANRTWEAEFFRASYENYRKHPYLKSNPRFHDISSVLDSVAGELYLDSEHLAPEGNRIIAEAIASQIVFSQPLRPTTR